MSENPLFNWPIRLDITGSKMIVEQATFKHIRTYHIYLEINKVIEHSWNQAEKNLEHIGALFLEILIVSLLL